MVNFPSHYDETKLNHDLVIWLMTHSGRLLQSVFVRMGIHIFIFFRTTGPVSVKLRFKAFLLEKDSHRSTEGPRLFLRGDNSEIVNILLNNLLGGSKYKICNMTAFKKIFSPITTRIISTKFDTINTLVKSIHVCVNVSKRRWKRYNGNIWWVLKSFSLETSDHFLQKYVQIILGFSHIKLRVCLLCFIKIFKFKTCVLWIYNKHKIKHIFPCWPPIFQNWML